MHHLIDQAASAYLLAAETKLEMEDFWATALSGLQIWLVLIVTFIMVPAMFGFSLGISEAYMTILVKTLEVLSLQFLCCSQMYQY